MPLVLDEVKELLRGVIRSIDRKADFTVSLLEGDRPGASVNISLRKHSTTVVVPAEQIEAASQFTMNRSQLRTTLKRAIDRHLVQPLSCLLSTGQIEIGDIVKVDLSRDRSSLIFSKEKLPPFLQRTLPRPKTPRTECSARA